ncbi:hypothetical protein MBLNU459_g5070t1 [Dothideomycetes sp. NU459]
MLRRKTPHGVLTGAYESNAHDGQALKHVLLPRNDGIQGFAQFPQIDSMLHQGPQQYYSAHQFYGQTVPSVLHPSFHHPGPTAPGLVGQGPYGPYWHDGTYEPYRPAALRDPRFYNQTDVRWGGNIGYGRMSSWQNEHPALVYPVKSSTSGSWHVNGSLYSSTVPSNANIGYSQTATHPGSLVPDFGPSPANAQQREKCFYWALQCYRELLAYIHPPSTPSHQHFQVLRFLLRRALSVALNGQSNAASVNARHLDSNLNATRPPHVVRRASDGIHTLRRSSGASISPIVNSLPQDPSPESRAINALATISKLCEETDWQWIDGIHLGGCLIFGLGKYEKALRWYMKVLELDSRHLEARSNLAATLVHLGREKEAEEHWMTVIKFAPNHFEAVEHLIGLLCHGKRTKDAIKTIDHVEGALRTSKPHRPHRNSDQHSECSASTTSRSPGDTSDRAHHDFEADNEYFSKEKPRSEPGFGSSGYSIPGSDNGRILALVHAKGNMLYSIGDNAGAAKAFEDAVIIAAGRQFTSVQDLVRHVLSVISTTPSPTMGKVKPQNSTDPVLLYPEQVAQTARHCFPHYGELPGLQWLQSSQVSAAKNAAIATTSNSLLSLAKIFQDNMSTTSHSLSANKSVAGVREILALYYLSLSLQPSPSTANNVGILLASVQQSAPLTRSVSHNRATRQEIPGVLPGSGIALALAYYNYGLRLDSNHAHLYTNLGSLLKDIGQLDAAVEMYKRAVNCDGKFDIALANLANAVKDKGRISEAIGYYKRAVEANPDFAEAVCGLANALNSVCGWQSRGGIASDGGKRDRWHVDQHGMLLDAALPGTSSSGWITRVVSIVESQLAEGEEWGKGTLTSHYLDDLVRRMMVLEGDHAVTTQRMQRLRKAFEGWAGRRWEGARITRFIERATKRASWHWYQDKHIRKTQRQAAAYDRPHLPSALNTPNAPTILPFHTFTCPMSAKQIRLISQRNGYRISASTLRMPWLPPHVYPPPPPPSPHIKVGYVSSDFNNHPLAHLMQSVFGMHDPERYEAYCYATTASDNSVHRRQIEAEAPVFYDASNWPAERLVNQIVQDGIHILVNLNGYTRGARNEVFAARPAPIQMSFMGFAGTLGAEWCDYLLADETAVPPTALRPWRRNVDLEDQIVDENSGGSQDSWIYGENIIYCRDTFFCCDHRQSAPDSQDGRLSWDEEQRRRWAMRKELFPNLANDAVIFGNFNQLYKIEPTTFRSWLRILGAVRNSILWLLRFPDLGETNLLRTAQLWAGSEVASRVIFTDVAPKHLHISRAKVCDLFLDTPECNAHTTAADVLWSGTPLLTYPRFEYKMCSRMAASILKGALPKTPPGAREQAERDLIASSDEEYEALAIALGTSLRYPKDGPRVGKGSGRLMDLRQMLTDARWSSALFDTRRWTADLEDAYDEAWRRWVKGEGGDIWLDQVPCFRANGRIWMAR